MQHEVSLFLDFQSAGVAIDKAERLLADALGSAPVASVLIRGTDDSAARRLVALVQRRNIAALAGDSPRQAKDLSSDGIHLPWADDIVERLKAARRDAVSGTIIGADAGRVRHDAMELGEAGADYVAFGIPPHVEDRARAAERRLDLVQWWSELFEVPCVAMDVATPADAAALAAAGADFVAVTLDGAVEPADARSHIRAFAEAIGLHETAR